MNFFQRRKILKKLNYLEATPIRLCGHRVEEDGKVTIVVPKFRNQSFNNWFVGRRRSKNFNIHLDREGTDTWLLIDGKKTTGEICSELTEKGMDSPEERATKFLTTLYEQRYITFREIQEQ
jgi:hypothetical protein